MFGRYWIEHGSKLKWAHEVASYAKRIITVSGDVKLCDFGPVEAAYLIEELRAGGMGIVAINRAISVIRGAHTFAGKRWGAKILVIDWRILKNKEPKERIRWLTREEATRLLSCLPPHIALIIEWSLYTGIRKNETLSLRWEAVNFAAGYAEIKVKGGHTRQLILSESAKDVLARTPKTGTLVFDKTNLRKFFEAGLEAAGIMNFRFHDLRHTNATWLRQEGASLEVIQRSLGHSSIQVTQRYAHVHDEEVRAAGNSIDPLFASNVTRLPERRASRFVYFVTDGDSVKIGKSSDPGRRMRILQTGHPKRLWLIGTVSAEQMTEEEAHSRFALARERGEWFEASAEMIREIERLCRDGKSHHAGSLSAV